MDFSAKYPLKDLKDPVEPMEPVDRKDRALRGNVLKLLQAALQLELTTVPLYMNGMYSIKPGTNEDAYHLIRSVVLEEMLHMVLAGNLINALGGRPVLDQVGTEHDSVPLYPAQMPYAKETAALPLRPFSEKALETFIAIESPPKLPKDLKIFETIKKTSALADEELAGWSTIGEFYTLILQRIEALLELHGGNGKKVFTGDPARQIGPEDFYNSGGEAFPVLDMASARKAIEVITEQGEGLHADLFTSDDLLFGEERQVAHFFRFLEVRFGRRYSPHDTARDMPGGAPLAVDFTARYDTLIATTRTDAQKQRSALPADQRALLDDFDRTYAKLLAYLHFAFNGRPEDMKAAIPLMLDLRYKAEHIFRNPLPGQGGKHLHPTYEVTPALLTQASRDITAGTGQDARQHSAL